MRGPAHQPLLLRLAVRVLKEGGEQLQRVALGARRAANGRVYQIEFGPGPSRDVSDLEIRSRHLSLDRGDVRIEPYRGRTPVTDHADGIHAFGAKMRARAEGESGEDQPYVRTNTTHALLTTQNCVHLCRLTSVGRVAHRYGSLICLRSASAWMSGQSHFYACALRPRQSQPRVG